MDTKLQVCTKVMTNEFNNTRMGSKVMPLANFHRNCWREDKTHAWYVFSILSPLYVSTAHVDTISLVKFTFAQTLLIGG